MSITTETKAYGFHAGKGIRMTIREEIEQLKKEKNAVILAHYYVRPEVQEIADYLSLNRSYLTELFVRTLHLSPQQFLMKYRITKAVDFLTYTDLSVEHIACSCGYANISSFSKAFKKVTGISPSQYRNEHQTYTS